MPPSKKNTPSRILNLETGIPETETQEAQAEYQLQGQLLIAMPMMNDPMFSRSVIYICAHSSDGAMGLIINQRAHDITFPALLQQLDILDEDHTNQTTGNLEDRPVHLGGPVETSRGFVLHTSDYEGDDATLSIGKTMRLTATVEILKDIATGSGPRQSLLALGYSGWSPGQLENEIQANGWLHCPADHELIFETALEAKHNMALSRLGIDPSHLSSEAGHA